LFRRIDPTAKSATHAVSGMGAVETENAELLLLLLELEEKKERTASRSSWVLFWSGAYGSE
jgi:hypothetical protein